MKKFEEEGKHYTATVKINRITDNDNFADEKILNSTGIQKIINRNQDLNRMR